MGSIWAGVAATKYLPLLLEGTAASAGLGGKKIG